MQTYAKFSKRFFKNDFLKTLAVASLMAKFNQGRGFVL